MHLLVHNEEGVFVLFQQLLFKGKMRNGVVDEICQYMGDQLRVIRGGRFVEFVDEIHNPLVLFIYDRDTRVQRRIPHHKSHTEYPYQAEPVTGKNELAQVLN
jgi:hypothetical protein